MLYAGLNAAVKKTYPKIAWQSCQFHFIRNIMDNTTKKEQKGRRTSFKRYLTLRPLRKRAAVLIDRNHILNIRQGIFSERCYKEATNEFKPIRIQVAYEQEKLLKTSYEKKPHVPNEL